MPNLAQARYKPWMEDPDFRRWVEAHGSAEYARKLFALLTDHLHLGPQEVVTLARQDRKALKDRLHDFAMTGPGEAGHKRNHLKALRSWLDHHEVETPKKFWPKLKEGQPKVRETQQAMLPEDVQRILDHATLKGRVIISIGLAGQRPQVIGKKGEDGLRLRDFPELVLSERIHFKQVPTLFIIRGPLNKAGHQFPAFLSQPGCEAVCALLERRRRDGETLGPDSPLVPNSRGGFLHSTAVGDEVRDAMRAAGVKNRPYSLKDHFEQVMFEAEAAGVISHSERLLWVGHKGDMSDVYATRKHNLPASMVEAMREHYAKASPALLRSKVAVAAPDPAALDVQELRKLVIADLIAGLRGGDPAMRDVFARVLVEAAADQEAQPDEETAVVSVALA